MDCVHVSQAHKLQLAVLLALLKMKIAGWRFCCMILYVKLIETPVYLLFRDKALWLFILGPFSCFVAEQHYVSF